MENMARVPSKKRSEVKSHEGRREREKYLKHDIMFNFII